MVPGDDVLFCTESFYEGSRDRLAAVAPELEVVLLSDGRDVTDDECARITLGTFTADAWPERAPAFMKVALRSPNLRWFHTMSAGTDAPVFRMFLDQGVTLTNSPGSSAAPIAATAITYLEMLARDMPRLSRAQADRRWDWFRWNELIGGRVGVVGWGPIGREVARLAEAHGMSPVVIRRAACGDEGYPVRRLDDLAAAVRDCDAVVLALPLNEATRGLVTADVFRAMPRGAFFVNVGRGEVVDEGALGEALRSGHLGGAGLDVFATEPLPAGDPVWDLPNVIVTPHNSGSTDGTGTRADEVFFENLRRWVEGAELAHVVGK